jgi:hypothetical protein
MVVAETSLKYYLSGGAANADPVKSLGGVISSVQVLDQRTTTTPPTKLTIFNNATAKQRTNGYTDYRCIYLKNTGAQTISGIRLWQNVETPGNDVVRIGYSGNAANVAEQNTATPTEKELYNVPMVGTRLYGIDELRSRVGVNVASLNANIHGEIINKWILHLKKNGLPTGTATLNCRNTLNDTVRFTLGTLDVATLTAVFAEKTFQNLSNSVALGWEDCLCLEFAGGTITNHITVGKVIDDPVKGVHAIARRKVPFAYWEEETRNDIAGRMYTVAPGGETTAPTAINFQNPKDEASAIVLPNLTTNSWVGIWFKREIPAASGPYPFNKFEIRLDYDSPST